jgi:hypothetical protein
LLLVLAKHTITNELEEPINIKDIKSDTIKLCREFGLSQKRFPQSTASYRFLCLKLLNERYQLNSKCPYEIIHTEKNCILPFRIDIARYDKYSPIYYEIIREKKTEQSYTDKYKETPETFRGHLSDVFKDELQFLMNFIEISENNGNVLLRINSQGKNIILPEINISSSTQSKTIKTNVNLPGVWKDTSTGENFPDPPDYFSLDYLKDWVRHVYDSKTGFLVVRFGSSVRPDINGLHNDEDYLILVHGNHYWGNDSERVERGASHSRNKSIDKPIDYRRQLFDSFLTALIIGLPFEVSMAFNGKLEHAYQMPSQYWTWLQLLAMNHTYDSHYIITELENDARKDLNNFIRAKNQKNDFNLVIAGYHLVCVKLQIQALKKAPPQLKAEQIYSLSQWEMLIDFIQSDELKKLFEELVQQFKRNKAPNNRQIFEENLKILLEGITRESQ